MKILTEECPMCNVEIVGMNLDQLEQNRTEHIRSEHTTYDSAFENIIEHYIETAEVIR